MGIPKMVGLEGQIQVYKMDDLGVPPFQEIPIYSIYSI